MNTRSLTMIDLLAALYRRKFLFLGTLIVVIGSGMIVTFLQAPTYQSEIKILMSRERVDPRVSPDERMDPVRPEFTDEEFNSELEILKSRAVIEGVVANLQLDRNDGTREVGLLSRGRAALSRFYRYLHKQQPPDAKEKALSRITDHLEVYSIKKSRIIKAVYRDSSPEKAAQVLDVLYRQYTDHHLNMLKNYKAANVFWEQSNIFKEKLSQLSDTLKQFDARNGVTANTSQKDLLLRQYYDTRSLHERAKTEILETEQRIASLEKQIAAQPERVESEVHTKYVAARDKIKDEIVTLDLQHTELLQKFQPNHRLVKDVEARLAQARELLAREEQTPPQETVTVLNDVHRRLTNELLTAQTALTSLRERERMLAGLAGQYHGTVARLDRKTIERMELERDQTASEEAYLLYRKKAQEADIASALNRERILNFTLTDPPAINHQPVSPKPLVNLAVLSLIGLVAGVSIVTFLERKRLLVGRYYHPLFTLDHRLAELTGMDADARRQLLPEPRYWNDRRLLLQDGRNNTKLPTGVEEAHHEPDSSGENHRQLNLTFDQSLPGNVAGPGPEDWRLEAVIEYLHRAYGLQPEQMSLFLQDVADWKISPEEILEILTGGAPETGLENLVGANAGAAFRGTERRIGV